MSDTETAPVKIPFYAQFDGDEIDGVRYSLGDPIKESVDGGTRAFLEQQGRIAKTPPAVSGLIPIVDKLPDDMTLGELRRAALAHAAAGIDGATEDDLRVALNRVREEGADDDDGKSPTEGSVAALVAHLDTMDEKAALESLRADEVAGKNRPTALAAIDKRIAAVG